MQASPSTGALLSERLELEDNTALLDAATGAAAAMDPTSKMSTPHAGPAPLTFDQIELDILEGFHLSPMKG